MMFEVTKNTIMPYKTAFTAMFCKVNDLLVKYKSKRSELKQSILFISSTFFSELPRHRLTYPYYHLAPIRGYYR